MSIDIFNATTLALIESLTYPGSITGGVLAYESDRKYLTVASAFDSSIGVIDLNDPNSPTVLGTLIDTPETAGVTAMLQDYRCVVIASGSNTALSIVSTLDPAVPVITSSLSNAAFANVAGMVRIVPGSIDVACVTDTSVKSVAATSILDSLVDATKFAGMIGLEKTGLYMVTVGTTNDWLTVIDGSDPLNIQIIGSLTNAAFGNATSFKIDGDYVAVATSSGTIVVVSIADLTAPVILFTYTNVPLIGSEPELLIVQGLYYVVNVTNSKITVFDFRPDAQNNFDNYLEDLEAFRFDFDGEYHTDSRLCLEFYGPAKLLAVTYEVDDTDNPPANGR